MADRFDQRVTKVMGSTGMLRSDDDRYDRHRNDRYDDRYEDRRPQKKRSILSEFFD